MERVGFGNARAETQEATAADRLDGAEPTCLLACRHHRQQINQSCDCGTGKQERTDSLSWAQIWWNQQILLISFRRAGHRNT